MGDLGKTGERALLESGQNLAADVLKVGHHGSRFSSTSELLEAVHPTQAVISVGEDSPYGHPAAETLARFREYGIQIFRTDLQGDITIRIPS